MLIIYLAIPKPYLTSQFATLSLTRGLPGQSQSEVEKEKQGGRLEDVRQESTIGTTVESEASGSLLIPEEVRRTSSSEVSIERRESNEPESRTSSWQDPRPLQLERIKEQEITTSAPQVQEMTTGVVGSPTPNLPSLADRNKTKAWKSHLVHTPFLSPSNASSPRGLVLQRNVSDPGSLNPSQSKSSRSRCSPCSDGMFSCCHASFNSLRRPPTLAISGPPPTVRAERLAPVRSAPTNQVSIEREWDDRLTDDLVQEYFSRPTATERQRFYDECHAKTNEPKMTRFDKSIDRQEAHQRRRADSIALARAAEIDRYINNNNRLLNDTIPVKGSPESSSTSRDYRSPNYQQNVPWQLRLVPKDVTKIKPTDLNCYGQMRAHTGDITMNKVASQQNQFDRCPERSKQAQKSGKEELLKAAIAYGTLRTLPANFDGRHNEQNLANILAILQYEPKCTFSAYKEVAALVEQAYQRLHWAWPTLEKSCISSSLPQQLFSIGHDNINKVAVNHADIRWVSTNKSGRMWHLKVHKESIVYKGGKVIYMFLLNQDDSHPDRHIETYNSKGVYIGIMDRKTLLIKAESLPFGERVARPEKDVK